MKSLVESILDIDDNVTRGNTAMKQALENYNQCVIFKAWEYVGHEIFVAATTNHTSRGSRIGNMRKSTYFELWKRFLEDWVTNSGFHSYFDVDEEAIIDCPITPNELSNSLKYIDELRIDQNPQMSQHSSGSSYEFFFDGDQRMACEYVLTRLSKVLNKKASTDINKKIREIEKKYQV